MIKSAAAMKYPTAGQKSEYTYLYEPDGKCYQVHPDTIIETTVRNLEKQYGDGHRTGYHKGIERGELDGHAAGTLAGHAAGYRQAEQKFGVRIRDIPSSDQILHLQKKISKQTFVLGLGLTTAIVAALNSMLNPIENILKLRDGLCYASEGQPAKDAHDVESCKRDGYFAIAGVSLVGVLASITIGTALYNICRRSRNQGGPQAPAAQQMQGAVPQGQGAQLGQGAVPQRPAAHRGQGAAPQGPAVPSVQEGPQAQGTATVAPNLLLGAPGPSMPQQLFGTARPVDDHSAAQLMSLPLDNDE